MHVYTVAIGKGGVGKSTTAAEMAYHLATAGVKTLLIDLDEQGNSSRRMGVDDDSEIEGVAADVLQAADPETAIREMALPAPGIEGVHVLIGTHDLSVMDPTKTSDLATILRDTLPSLEGTWDAVVIDTPPALGDLTLAAIAAADTVVAPMQVATEAWDELSRLVSVIEERVARRLKRGQQLHWVVPTMADRRRLLDQEVLEVLKESLPGKITNPIRSAQAVRDAYTAGQPVSSYAPSSDVAKDYRQALKPVLNASLGDHR